MAKILIIDDEPALRDMLGRILTGDAHTVTTAANARDGLVAALLEDFDLILLDLMLPDFPGDELLERLLRDRPRARALVLSAANDTPRVARLLTTGAVDFLAKPFAKAELLARVHARIRDANGAPAAAEVVDHGGLRLDLRRRELTVDGRRVELSQREFLLLTHLLGRRGQVCSREELLESVWGVQFDPGTNVVDVYVGRLRAKIEAKRIQTVRNVGYRIAA